MRMWTGLNWLKKGSLLGSCEHDNKHSGSIKAGEFLDHQNSC